MAIFPLEVEVNEKRLLKLTKVFKVAQAQIADELIGATDFGYKNRKAILKQIDEILAELGTEVGEKVIPEAIEEMYQTGAEEAASQLKEVTDGAAPVKTGFNRVHKQAVAALVDDTAKAFAESMTGVSRNARLLLNKAVKEEMTQRLATGKISGEALKRIKNEIVGIMQEQGIASLVDKGGKKWTLDRYAEMLIRTKSVEARNRGLANRVAEFKYDLVQVSDHGASSCPLCQPWQGKILSLRGETKGYPTLAEAERAGLFHPNCRHAINVLIPELASRTNAYDPSKKTRTIRKY